MNCIFIQSRTVRSSLQRFTPPLGLIVHDVPLFLLWVCEKTGYYDPPLNAWGHRGSLDRSVAWAFPSASVFVRGCEYTVEGDGTSAHLCAEIGGGVYRTMPLSLKGLTRRDVLDVDDTFIAKKDDTSSFVAKAASFLEENSHSILANAKDYGSSPGLKRKGPICI